MASLVEKKYLNIWQHRCNYSTSKLGLVKSAW